MTSIHITSWLPGDGTAKLADLEWLAIDLSEEDHICAEGATVWAIRLCRS